MMLMDIKKVLDVCIAINERTDKCAFFEYSPHVSNLHVIIAQSMKEYNNHIYSSSVYYEGDLFSQEECSKLLNDLKEYL